MDFLLGHCMGIWKKPLFFLFNFKSKSKIWIQSKVFTVCAQMHHVPLGNWQCQPLRKELIWTKHYDAFANKDCPKICEFSGITKKKRKWNGWMDGSFSQVINPLEHKMVGGLCHHGNVFQFQAGNGMDLLLVFWRDNSVIILREYFKTTATRNCESKFCEWNLFPTFFLTKISSMNKQTNTLIF